mgnify:CR=1 FL=1
MMCAESAEAERAVCGDPSIRDSTVGCGTIVPRERERRGCSAMNAINGYVLGSLKSGQSDWIADLESML